MLCEEEVETETDWGDGSREGAREGAREEAREEARRESRTGLPEEGATEWEGEGRVAWLPLDERVSRGDIWRGEASQGWASGCGVCQTSRALSPVRLEVAGVDEFSDREETLEYCSSKRRVSR
jgi:hypothetical protein